MATTLVLGRDINGNVTYEVEWSDTKVATTLAPDVEQTTVVPDGVNLAFFSVSEGTNVWVGRGSAPITLPGAAFASTIAELNPQLRPVEPGETLRFRCATEAEVNVNYFKRNV